MVDIHVYNENVRRLKSVSKPIYVRINVCFVTNNG